MGIYLWEREILTDSGSIAVDEACCCGGARCCDRELPAVLYLQVFNVPVQDPLSGDWSVCCSDGKWIALHLCQGDTTGTLPSRWRSDADGEVWCDGTGRLWFAEMSCGNPQGLDPTSANAILKVGAVNPNDHTDCNWNNGQNFDCMPDGSLGASQLANSFALNSVTSTCTPFYFEFGTTGYGSPISADNNCCDDNTTVGWIRFVITEYPP